MGRRGGTESRVEGRDGGAEMHRGGKTWTVGERGTGTDERVAGRKRGGRGSEMGQGDKGTGERGGQVERDGGREE